MELLPRCGDIMKSDFYFQKMERNRGGGFHFFFLIFIPARSDYISLFNRNEYYAVEDNFFFSRSSQLKTDFFRFECKIIVVRRYHRARRVEVGHCSWN